MVVQRYDSKQREKYIKMHKKASLVESKKDTDAFAERKANEKDISVEHFGPCDQLT